MTGIFLFMVTHNMTLVGAINQITATVQYHRFIASKPWPKPHSHFIGTALKTSESKSKIRWRIHLIASTTQDCKSTASLCLWSVICSINFVLSWPWTCARSSGCYCCRCPRNRWTKVAQLSRCDVYANTRNQHLTQCKQRLMDTCSFQSVFSLVPALRAFSTTLPYTSVTLDNSE